jgi:hypothetical protein
MKKSILIAGVSLLISLSFTSCKKDKPLSDLIIGKWDAEYVITYFYKNNVLGQELKTYIDAGTVMLQINAGGTGIYTESGNDYLYSWTFDNTSFTINGLSQEAIVLNLTMDGDKLTWSWPIETSSTDATVTYQDFFTAKRIN